MAIEARGPWAQRSRSLVVTHDSFEKEFTRKIMACNTHADLRDLIVGKAQSHAACIQSFNRHHISATMMTIAKLDARHMLERDGGLQLGRQLLQRALQPEVIDTLAPRQASSILWSASSIGLWLDCSSIEVMLEKSLPAIIQQTSPPNSKDLSMVLLSCSSLGYEPSLPWMKRFEIISLRLLVQEAARAASYYSGSFNPSQLSHILYSLASIKHTPSRIWLEAFSSFSMAILSKLDIPALCGIAWAAGFHQRSVSSTFLWPEDSWVKEAVSSSLPLLPDMDSKHLASILWALARLQVSPSPPAVLPSLSTSSSHSIQERRPSNEWMDCFIGSSRRHADSFDPRSLSNLLHALVELKYRPAEEWLDDMLAPLVPTKVVPKDPSPTLQDVASLLRSCRLLGYLPRQPVIHTLLNVTYREMDRLNHLIKVGSSSEESLTSSNSLIDILSSLGKMRILPTSEWMTKFWVISSRCLSRLCLRQMSRLLAAVASLQIQYSKDSTKDPALLHLVPKEWARQALSALSALLKDYEADEGHKASNIPSSGLPLGLILQLSWAISISRRLTPSDIILRTRLLQTATSSISSALDRSKNPTAEMLRTISQLPTFLAAAGCSRAVDKSRFGNTLFSCCLSYGSLMDGPSLGRLLSGIDAMGYSPSRSFMAGLWLILEERDGLVGEAKDPETLLNLLFSISKLAKKSVQQKKGPRASLDIIPTKHLRDMKESVLVALESGGFRDSETPLRLLLTLSNLGFFSINHADQPQDGQSIEQWWSRVYEALDGHLDDLSSSTLPSLLYFIASHVIASRKQLHPVPTPDARLVDRVMEKILSGTGAAIGDAEDVARVLCGLVGLGGSKWLPQVSHRIETISASFSRADHLLIQKAWMRMDRV